MNYKYNGIVYKGERSEIIAELRAYLERLDLVWIGSKFKLAAYELETEQSVRVESIKDWIITSIINSVPYVSNGFVGSIDEIREHLYSCNLVTKQGALGLGGHEMGYTEIKEKFIDRIISDLEKT